MYDPGRNSGITGLVDITGSPAFQVFVRAWREITEGSLLDISGRGDDAFGEYIIASPGGTLVVTGNPQLERAPLPSDYLGRTGTVTATFTGSATQTVAVQVTGCTIEQPDKRDASLWRITLTCRITAVPTFAGFTSAPSAAAAGAARDPKETWSGTGKTLDPDGIQDGATRRYVVFGVADTDAGEEAAIAAAIAENAVAPMTGLKVRSSSFQRINHVVGVVLITYALTTTGEDILNQNTFLTTDASGLETVGKSAAWGTTPVEHDGLVIRKVTVLEYNDGKVLYTTEEGLESVKDQREREATQTTIDPNNLVAGARVTLIAATQPETPTAPTGTVYRSVDKQKQEDGRFAWTFTYAPRDSKQDIEFDSVIAVDGSALASSAELLVVQSTDAPDSAYTSPATPPFTGAVYRDYRRKQITANPAQYLYTYFYGYETRATEIVREHTRETLGNWRANATTASWDGTGTHATLTALTGTETLLYPNGKTLTVKHWGLETDPQQWVREHTDLSTDASGILSAGHLAQIGAAPSAPTGFELVKTEQQTLPDGTVGYVITYAKANTAQRIAAAGTRLTTDVGGINPREEYTEVTDSATADTTPTFTLAGVTHYETVSEPVPDNPAKWKHTYRAQSRTSAEEVADAGSSTTIEVSGLEDEGAVQVVTDSATAPAVPDVPAGLPAGVKHIRTVSQRRGAKWVHRFSYGYATSAERKVRAMAWRRDDPAGLDSEAVVATIGTATAGDGTGLIAAGTETRTDESGVTISLDRYNTVGDGAARRELESTHGSVDPYEYEKWQDAEVVETADLRAYLTTLFATLVADSTFHRVSGRKLPGGKALIVKEYTKDEKILLTDFYGGMVNMKSLGGQVAVVDVVPISSTWSNFTTDYCTVNRVTGTLVYRRRIVSATWSDALHYSAIGKLNNATLLGVAAGYLQYVGARVRSSEYVSENHVRLIDYILKFDSAGFVEDSRVGIGTFHTNASISKGFVNASTLGWTVSAPASADLGFIIA